MNTEWNPAQISTLENRSDMCKSFKKKGTQNERGKVIKIEGWFLKNRVYCSITYAEEKFCY